MSFLSVQILYSEGYLKCIALRQVLSRYSDREDAGKTSLVRLRMEQYTVISRNLFILSLYDDVLAGVALAVHLSVPGHHWTRQREAPRVLLPMIGASSACPVVPTDPATIGTSRRRRQRCYRERVFAS